jgi:tetratricopeptide (TPR) repeat protein
MYRVAKIGLKYEKGSLTLVNITKEHLDQLLNRGLSANERARLRCRYAKQLEEAGNYDKARDAMGELWQGVGERPTLEGLDEQTKGDVLLRAGTLSGWIGSTKQIEGAQETAKNLISESIAIFGVLSDVKKLAEAQIELGVCYWREGAIDNARVMLAEALSHTDDQDGDLRAIALLRSAAVEKVANRLNDALNTLKAAAPLFERSSNNTIKGRFHNEYANVLRRLSEIENRCDYMDQAVVEYTAASVHFEEAHHTRYQACVENNLALVYLKINRLANSHEHLDLAETLFTTLNDVVHLAQVAETRARVMLAEGAVVQAERSARRAVQLFERGDERSLLAEALSAQGTALSRLGHKNQARAVLERAIHEAEQAGDLEGAGLAGTYVDRAVVRTTLRRGAIHDSGARRR